MLIKKVAKFQIFGYDVIAIITLYKYLGKPTTFEGELYIYDSNAVEVSDSLDEDTLCAIKEKADHELIKQGLANETR